MHIENKINEFISDYPKIKKGMKRLYQAFFYAISPKIKKEGNIKKVSPNDGFEYFFGYYDKSPWDISNRYMLSLKVKDTTCSEAPNEKADIVLIDTENNNKVTKLASTNTWNVQQGAMLQWLGPDFSKEIIYNDFRNGKYCSVKLNIKTNKETILDYPVYSVSEDGTHAVTLDFSRLHRLRKGYGYSNIKDQTADMKIPNTTCIWYLNLNTNQAKSVLKYTDLFNFETRSEMFEAEHKVNHIMLNPKGDRFMVLHRWKKNRENYTRLLTINIDGSEIYNLSDDDMVSHCTWKSNDEILGYLRKNSTGNGYYLMKDKTEKYKNMWQTLKLDGHPSYSPDGSKVVTDTYPDRTRMASVYLIDKNEVNTIAKVFAPFKYDNNFRCDLHPRWDRKGSKISIDAVFENKRALYNIILDE